MEPAAGHPAVSSLGCCELVRWLRRRKPQNLQRDEGFALLDLQAPGAGESGGIPGALHVAADDEPHLLRRFAHDKPIVVYGSDHQSERARRMARNLAECGFVRVYLLTGGPTAWLAASRRLATGRACPAPVVVVRRKGQKTIARRLDRVVRAVDLSRSRG